MRIPVLLLALVAAGPALAQASDPSRSGLAVSLAPPYRVHAVLEEMLPAAAYYSWVDEADGRFVAAPGDGYLTPAQRTAWAAGEDVRAVVRTRFAVVAASRWLPVAPSFACDVLKCLRPEALNVATTSDVDPDARPRVLG